MTRAGLARAASLGGALAGAVLAACAPSPGGRVGEALAAIDAQPSALLPEETAEIARLRALPVRPRDGADAARALATWDWRSALSGRGPPAPFWSEGGATYAAALAGREDAALTPPDRVAAAEIALEAARRARAFAGGVQARAEADLAEAAAARARAPGAKTPPAAETRARSRAALLAAMAASVGADATAVAQDAAALGVYAGPARRAMTAVGADLAAVAAELEGRAAAVARLIPG